MDPNIQVAFVSVLATLITTAGVVAVAVINNRKERSNTADFAVDAALDDKDVLTRMLALINEKEELEAVADELRLENRRLRAEITALRLGIAGRHKGGGP